MTSDIIDYKELDGLSEKERAKVLEILREYTQTGQSNKYDGMLCDDYEEIPVDIVTFLKDNRYLGQGLVNSEGKFTVYPYWVETLKKIFPNSLEPAKYNTLALSGAIGLGKSFVGVLCVLYDLYRMMCLKDPYLHYGLQPIDKITFAFINITIDAAKGVAWSKCQELLQSSDWFMARGTLSRGDIPQWKPPKGIELVCGSQSRHILGRAVFSCFCDEISFQLTQDIEKQKTKAKNLVSTASARMQSRFMKGDKNPTLLILASSKRSENSYMETFIDGKRKNESKTTYIVDEPQWVIRTDKDSKEKFKVAVGNKFLNSELIPLNASEEEVAEYRRKGYTILEVPIGYYENFLDDIEIALTDIAGISTTSAFKYISGSRWSETIKAGHVNPFAKEVLEVGNAKDDTTQYYDYFDLSKVPKECKGKPLYIHLDMSISGDKTGIAGVWIIGKTPHIDGVPDSKELHYRLAFSVAIKAPKGHEISFEKNRNFIRWLKSNNFLVKGVSSDTYQSADLRQTLLYEGYNYEIVSVDRVTNRICEPYQYFRSTIYEKRIETYPTVLLTEEIINLEKDSNGKVNHPMGGTVGSKDIADAVAGATWNASQHAQEFAFDYGETLDAMIEVSKSSSYEGDVKQMTVDFEEELKKLFNPMNMTRNIDEEKSAETIRNLQYLYNGIII